MSIELQLDLLEQVDTPESGVDTTRNEAAELLGKYLASNEAIKKLSEAHNVSSKQKKELQKAIYREYNAKISALSSERDSLIRDSERENAEGYAEYLQRVEVLHEDIAAVERILSLLRWQIMGADKQEYVDFAHDEATLPGRGDKYIECIDVFYQDPYLKVCAYVHENDRPKNRYTLILAGRCWFPESILEWPHNYIRLHAKGYGNFNLGMEIAHKHSVDDLKKQYEKKRASLLTPEMQRYQDTRTEYLHTIETYTVDDFKPLLAYVCGCGYFETWSESEHQRHIDELNSQAYKCRHCDAVLTPQPSNDDSVSKEGRIQDQT